MHTNKMILSQALFLGLAASCFAEPTSASSDNAQGVSRRRLRSTKPETRFFTADAAPMNRLWSHAEDIHVHGPCRRFPGRLGAGAGRLGSRKAALQLGGEVLPEQSYATIGSDLATFTRE